MNDQNAKQNIAQDKLIIQNYNRIADNVDPLRIAIQCNDPASLPSLINDLNALTTSLMSYVSKVQRIDKTKLKTRELDIEFHTKQD